MSKAEEVEETKIAKEDPATEEDVEKGEETDHSSRSSTIVPASDEEKLKKMEEEENEDDEESAKGFLPRMVCSHMALICSPQMRRMRAVLLHLGLIATCILYIVVGAWIFLSIERPLELAQREKAVEKFAQMREQLLDNVSSLTFISKAAVEAAVDTYIEKMLGFFNQPHAASTFETHFMDYSSQKDQWTFSSAVLFTATTVIPVGYGYVAPVSELGRWLIVGYGIVGIPLALVTIADTGKFIAQFITNYFEESLRVPTVLFLVLLFSYPLLGGLILHYTADMSLLDSVYFSLTSIFTIGFGDLAVCPSSLLEIDVQPQVNVVNLVLFIVFGVILVTITIDFVAAELIDHIHYMGRHVGRAKELAGKMLQMAQNLNMTSVSVGMAQLHALARFGLLGNVDKKALKASLKPQQPSTFHPQFDDFDFVDAASAQVSVRIEDDSSNF